MALPTANGLACASNINPLRYVANSHFVLRNLLRIRNATVRIRQMVRTLNAQFCCVPDCVPCPVFLDVLVSQYCFNPLLESLFCRSLGLPLPEQSKFRALIAAYWTAYCEPVERT